MLTAVLLLIQLGNTFSCLAPSLLAVNKMRVHYSGVEVAVALLLCRACAHDAKSN